jgi:nicotinate-nucleotide adenylyltransferase
MVIVYGGAFNPVTKAHIKVCDFVMNKYPNATFVFLPVSKVYAKSNLVDNIHRYNMLQMSIKNKKNVFVSDLELKDTTYLGTYQSLIRFKKMYNDSVYFVVGSDNLKNMDQWINSKGLLTEFKIIVLSRPMFDIESAFERNALLRTFKDSFIVFSDFNTHLSSSQFRETFDENIVPKEVYQYILKNRLYRGEQDV